MARNLLKSCIQNASFNIIFQVLFRCLTFVINAWVLRHVGHAIIGIMNVRLLLLESTILFLSREPFLRACLGHKGKLNWPQVINQMWLPLPLSVVFSLVFVYIWLHVLTLGHPEYFSQYTFGCWSMAISCIIELLSANVSLVAQIFCFIKLKIVLDTVYVLVRTIIFLVILMYDFDKALIAFSLAQIISAVILSLGYYIYFYWYIKKFNQYKQIIKKNDEIQLNDYFENMDDFPFTSIKDFFPKNISGNNLDTHLLTLTISFAKQGFVKQLLTEGEKYVMSISPVMSFSEQAMYDVVNNLGSIAARFIFRPLEDSGYFYFTQTIERNKSIYNQNKEKMLEASTVLYQLCRVVTSIGVIALAFGQSYSRTLLLLYGGENFIENGLPVILMRCHCLAIVLLAINGVTECFTFATMTSKQLDRYNYLMVIFSITFLVLSYILTYLLGPIGFIISNCINMSTRIIYSCYFINNRYKGTNFNPLNGLSLGYFFIITLIISGILCKIFENYLIKYTELYHILHGIFHLMVVLCIWLNQNLTLVKMLYLKYKNIK